MADKESYSVPGIGDVFPNLESACEAAQVWAASSDRPVEVIRRTEACVRRYQRQITVTETVVSALTPEA